MAKSFKYAETVSQKFYECVEEGRQFGLLDDYVLLVQSQGKYLAIRVDAVYEGGFLSEGVYYSMQFNFMAINKIVADLIAKKGNVGALNISEEKVRVN